MEKIPGAEAKIQEYITRIQNGEDKEVVLQGLGPAFRNPVEEGLKSFEEKENPSEEKENSASASLSEDIVLERQKQDSEKIETLRQELGISEKNTEDPFKHKEPEWDDYGHKQAIGMYNTFMDIGKGLSQGLKESFDPKVQQYVDEINAGKSKEYVLSGAPKSIVEAVEKVLAKDTLENSTEDNRLEKIHGIESMKSLFNEIGKTHYLFSHQTGEDTAKNIYNTNFEVGLGTGISSTMTFVGPDGLINQIERQIQGDAHRGYKGMFVVAVPKELLDVQQIRNKAEALEVLLAESSDYGKDGNSNIVIPSEYNLGYLQGEDFYLNKEIVGKE